jgi:toxin CcdB
LIHQFDIHRNPSLETSQWAPYLLVLQSDLLSDLQTTVVAPLVHAKEFGRPATTLNPVFDVQGERVVLSVAELAGVSGKQLGERVGSLAARRHEIIAAIDLLFTGI